MSTTIKKTPSSLLVVVAFLTVYLVWGSTYLFIRIAVEHFPPMIMGALRFISAGVLLFIWCFLRGEKLFSLQIIKPAAVSGILLLFIGNGAVIWTEQFLPSGFVAVLIGAAPIWFVLLDYYNWKDNFSNKEVIFGLVIGFIGVLLLFGQNALQALSVPGSKPHIIALCILIAGSISWCAGSLYSKYKSQGNSNSVNAAWQMLAGGAVFLIASMLRNEWAGFHFNSVHESGWFALFYLIIFGSLAGYSAYIWLLQVRPAIQVSTYAYVNPVVAVLLGIFIIGEKITLLQVAGLAIILTGVFLLNLSKYRSQLRSVNK